MKNTLSVLVSVEGNKLGSSPSLGCVIAKRDAELISNPEKCCFFALVTGGGITFRLYCNRCL